VLPLVARQQRSLDVTESREYYLVVTVEPQRELVRQVLSRVRRTDDAAGRDDRVGRFIERRSQRLEFTRTKIDLAGSRRYCAAHAVWCENVVGVDGLAVPERSERSSDRGLSGAGETDEDEAAHVSRTSGDEVEPRFAMYDAWFARTPPRSRRRTFVGPRWPGRVPSSLRSRHRAPDGRHVGAFLERDRALARHDVHRLEHGRSASRVASSLPWR